MSTVPRNETGGEGGEGGGAEGGTWLIFSLKNYRKFHDTFCGQIILQTKLCQVRP